jgi:hypothetical protein
MTIGEKTCQFHQYIGETLPVPPMVMVETKRVSAAVPRRLYFPALQ